MTKRVLSEADVEQFAERGYVRLQEAFSPEDALRAQGDVWEQLALRGVHKDDPATWTQPMVSLTENYDTPAFRACKTERLKNAVEDLVGVGRWRTRETQDGWGWWPVNFAYGADRPWDVPDNGWHWDGQHFRHYVNAPDQGLLLLCIFSDIKSHGGATLVAEGSHKIVARYLSCHPEGVELLEGIKDCPTTHPWLADLTGKPLAPTACYDAQRFQAWEQSGDRPERFMNRTFVDDNGFALRVVEVIASPGDIYLCHPFLFHCASQNHLRTPRFLCNRTTPLYESLCLDRPDGDYSPLEMSIRRALAAD
jgi:hypothetical protein